MSAGRSPAARSLVGVIRTYQLVISPTRMPTCRFTPTCSTYALGAVETHGALRGTTLAVRRVLRCHPWHVGGHDPVPPRVLSMVDTSDPQPAGPVRVISAPVSTLRLTQARRPVPRPRSRRPAV